MSAFYSYHVSRGSGGVTRNIIIRTLNQISGKISTLGLGLLMFFFFFLFFSFPHRTLLIRSYLVSVQSNFLSTGTLQSYI